MRDAGSALIGYYYFDYKDSSKRDIRGMLASVLLQLIGDSDRCRDALYQLYSKCRKGSEQPSHADLATCLQNILKLSGKLPIFIILDALDECRVPLKHHLPAKRCWTLWRNLLGQDIRICSSVLQVVPSKTYKLTLTL